MINKYNLYGGFQVDCDSCGETLANESANIDDVTVKNAIETARMYGWSIGKQNFLESNVACQDWKCL